MMAPSSFQMSATPLPSLPTTLLTHCVFNIRQKRNNSKANKNAKKKRDDCIPWIPLPESRGSPHKPSASSSASRVNILSCQPEKR